MRWEISLYDAILEFQEEARVLVAAGAYAALFELYDYYAEQAKTVTNAEDAAWFSAELFQALQAAQQSLPVPILTAE